MRKTWREKIQKIDNSKTELSKNGVPDNKIDTYLLDMLQMSFLHVIKFQLAIDSNMRKVKILGRGEIPKLPDSYFYVCTSFMML